MHVCPQCKERCQCDGTGELSPSHGVCWCPCEDPGPSIIDEVENMAQRPASIPANLDLGPSLAKSARPRPPIITSDRYPGGYLPDPRENTDDKGGG